MSKEKTTVRVSIDLPKALRDLVEEAATAEDHNFASAVRIALREWADRVLSGKNALFSS